MQQRLGIGPVKAATGRRYTSVRDWTGAILRRPPKRGVQLEWTLPEAVALVIARRLIDRGLTIPAALDLAGQIWRADIIPQILDEPPGERRARWVAIWPTADGPPGGIRYAATLDAGKMLDVIGEVGDVGHPQMLVRLDELVVEAATALTAAAAEAGEAEADAAEAVA